MVVLKTRLQVSHPPPSAYTAAATILRHEGLLAFYRGFTTSLASTIPARTLYMTALKVTKSVVSSAALRLGFPEPATSTAAGAAAGLSITVAAQVVWIPVDVISQRLMVQRCHLQGSRYLGDLDAFRKILSRDGIRGLPAFGISMLTASNVPAHRLLHHSDNRLSILPRAIHLPGDLCHSPPPSCRLLPSPPSVLS